LQHAATASKRPAPARIPARPRFRTLGSSYDLDNFEQCLQSGPQPGHPDMPAFKMNAEDAHAAAAYLRSIQQ
jgi:hypothetical protein